jgi:hypothetical protein
MFQREITASRFLANELAARARSRHAKPGLGAAHGPLDKVGGRTDRVRDLALAETPPQVVAVFVIATARIVVAHSSRGDRKQHTR